MLVSATKAARTGRPARQGIRGGDRIVNALSAIQDQFDLILVIIHIQELKEMFPIRIEVGKTGEGPTFSVVA